MAVKARLKDAAKRYLSPDAQDAVKTLLQRASGPRTPTRLKPAPSDPKGAARHAVLIAHASRRAPDFVRARKAMGRLVLDDPTWTPAVHVRLPVQAAEPAVTVEVVAAPAPGAPTTTATPNTTMEPAGSTLRIGLPGAHNTDAGVLPHCGQLLNSLGLDEQVAVLSTAALAFTRGRRVVSVNAVPADDQLAAAVARTLQAACAEGPVHAA